MPLRGRMPLRGHVPLRGRFTFPGTISSMQSVTLRPDILPKMKKMSFSSLEFFMLHSEFPIRRLILCYSRRYYLNPALPHGRSNFLTAEAIPP
jgi:hypothetical protein